MREMTKTKTFATIAAAAGFLLLVAGCSSTDASGTGSDAGATAGDVGGGALDVATDGTSAADGTSGGDTATSEDTASAADTSVPVATCTSGSWWTGGNKESPLMHPGGDCIGCHKNLGEGPTFAIAGTLFPTLYEKVDCNGTSGGATVVITGSDGKEFNLPVNAAGNFYIEALKASTLKLPYTAKVVSAAGTNAMATPQTIGGCNTCHGDPPSGGAPGRIVAP